MTRPQKYRDVVAALRHNSWAYMRQTGSHETWAHCTCGAETYESDDSSATSSAASTSSEASNSADLFGSRRAIERRKSSVRGTSGSGNGSGSTAPTSTRAAARTVSRKEKRRPQLRLDTFVEPAARAQVAVPEEPTGPVELEAEKPADGNLEMPRLATCSCFSEAVESATPIKGKGGLGSLRAADQKALTRHADRITIAIKKGGYVDAKCIMMLKRTLQWVPEDW